MSFHRFTTASPASSHLGFTTASLASPSRLHQLLRCTKYGALIPCPPFHRSAHVLLATETTSFRLLPRPASSPRGPCPRLRPAGYIGPSSRATPSATHAHDLQDPDGDDILQSDTPPRRDQTTPRRPSSSPRDRRPRHPFCRRLCSELHAAVIFGNVHLALSTGFPHQTVPSSRCAYRKNESSISTTTIVLRCLYACCLPAC